MRDAALPLAPPETAAGGRYLRPVAARTREDSIASTPLVDFAALYAEHARDVHRFALYLSGDPALADDLTSETFVRAWGARDRIDLGTVRGYLLAIARNLFLHELRRERPRSDLLTGSDPEIELRSDAPSPERRALAKSELARVATALQSLPEVDRAALLLRAGDELPYEEIARILGLTLSAAKVKVHRARLRLAEARAESEKPK